MQRRGGRHPLGGGTPRLGCIFGIARYCPTRRSAYAHQMNEEAAAQPLIHCTPPTDPSFLASVSRSYLEAAAFLSGEAAVLVGTLVRLRMHYPMASIIPLSVARPDAPFAVWLVSREGWTGIEPVSSPSGGVARDAATETRAARPEA